MPEWFCVVLVGRAAGLPREIVESGPAIADRVERGERAAGLFPQVQLLDHAFVPVRGGPLQVIEKFAAAGDHLQQTAPGGMIFDVALEMIGELVDALGEKGHLDVRAAGILFVHSQRLNILRFGHIDQK